RINGNTIAIVANDIAEAEAVRAAITTTAGVVADITEIAVPAMALLKDGNNLGSAKDLKPIDIKKFPKHKKGKNILKYEYKGRPTKAYWDQKTKAWWAEDRANHGGVQYKVFEPSGNNYLEWIYDADEFGRKIIGKHKGKVGLIVKIIGYIN
ncbi:hypothetical protein HRU45_04295, partial [Candidatus Dependentiae bacterium]|nr:hypothetical protein [Candidatus Dependentiae bacterium]